MRPLISIGRFSELTGLSVRALRLYEQGGLLRPAVVDARTGYRFYRWHQKVVAERIRALRDLEVPLELITRCLHQGLGVQEALALHEAQLQAEVAELERLLGRVRSARVALPLPEFQVRVREQASQPLLTVRYRTALSHCEADRWEAYQALKRRALRLGTREAGPPYGWHPPTGGFNPEDYLVQLCLPVREAVPGSEAGYGGLIAFTQQRGDLSRLLHAYQAVADWVQRSPYEKAGPGAERYLCRLQPGVMSHVEVWQPVRLSPRQAVKEES